MNARLSLVAAVFTLIADEKPTFWIVPHTHWEGAVFKTREEYLEMGLGHILQAMHLLKTQPEFRFVLDQVAYVRPFLERHPEQLADFRRFVQEGRLELVLGMDVMADDNMPGGETFVRQVQYGKSYFRELGADVTAAWFADTFGHHAQMPQLLKLGGYTSFWFFRGVPRPDHPSEFLWEGIDGTRIPAFWMPHGYGLMYGSPNELAAFKGFVQQRFDALDATSRAPDRFGPAGVDVCPPEAHLAAMVAAYNALPDAPIALRLAVPSEFAAVAARRTDRPVFQGELNPIFQGIYSSRIELKQWMREMERRLTTAEKLGALAAWLGTPPDLDTLWRAWELTLFNQTHDLASGVMTDHVYDDTVRSYEFARRLADGVDERGWNALAAAIDTSGEGVPVVVFNALGWARSELVEIDVSFAGAGIGGFAVVDPEGREVAAQTIAATRYDGSLSTARLAFLARDVPALGFAVHRVIARAEAGSTEAQPAAGDTLENEFQRVTLDRATGAITSLRLKAGDRELLAGNGNVVVREDDHGDLWELYRGLDGGSRIAMNERHPVPARGPAGHAKFSDESGGEPGALRVGPVFSEFRVAHPFDTGSFATTVRVVAGVRRVEIETTLVNREKQVRYQVLFPTTIQGGAPGVPGMNVHEIPFGAIARLDGIEFPAQNWVDYGDGEHGLALLNVGLPGNAVADGTLLLSVLRAHDLGAYGFGGGYEPGMSSESGFQLGKERTVRYALVPHAADWRDAGVFRDGLEFNQPLVARKATAHAGSLPKRWGLLDVSNRDVVVSALEPARDGSASLRIYEAAGRAASKVVLQFHAPIVSARTTNLLGDPGSELAVGGSAIRLDLAPFEIRTIDLRFGPAPSGR